MCIICAGFKMIESGMDSIRAGTSLGPPPFIQGREALNPQTAHAMVLAAKPGSRLCQTNGTPGLFVSDVEQPLSWVSRKPARRSPGKRGGAR